MMLEVKYINTCVDYYKIPDNLDLEDTTVVEEYWVKYRTLYIKYVGKDKVEEYEADYEDQGTDFKRPDEVDIVDADDTWVNYTEEDESDEEVHYIDEDNVNDYMKELLTCTECKKDVQRKDMYWKGSNIYLDTCKECYVNKEYKCEWGNIHKNNQGLCECFDGSLM